MQRVILKRENKSELKRYFKMEYIPHNAILATSGLILLPTSILAYLKYMETLSEQ